MRLIDAKELERQVKATFKYSNPVLMGQMLRWIRHQTTVDAVLVVRCKDCKWFANNNGGEWYGCQMFNAIRAVPEDAPKENDFCSNGERRAAE